MYSHHIGVTVYTIREWDQPLTTRTEKIQETFLQIKSESVNRHARLKKSGHDDDFEMPSGINVCQSIQLDGSS